MPAVSKAQARFMNAVAHNPSFAKEAGVSQAVGKEFASASSRYKALPERKGDPVKKKKSWIKSAQGEKRLKEKLSERPKRKSEDQRMADRYGKKDG